MQYFPSQMFKSVISVMLRLLTYHWFHLISSGEAEAIVARAEATAKGIALVSEALKENGGVEVRS